MGTEKTVVANLEKALRLLGYGVEAGSGHGMLKVRAPGGTEVAELSPSDCWAYLRERHREPFERNPPLWDEGRYGPFRLHFSGFCPECGRGTFNGRHLCPEGGRSRVGVALMGFGPVRSS